MKLLKKYLKPYFGRMSLGLVIKIIGTVMDLVLPWILSHIIDNVTPRANIYEILLWGAVMIAASVVAVTFNIWANRMASAVSRDCTAKVRYDLYAKISYLDAAQIDEFSISSLESRLTSDTYNLNQMIGMVQRMGVRAPILLFGGIVVTFFLDVRLTLVMLCTLPFIVTTVTFISKKSIPIYKNLQNAVDKITGIVRENAGGVRIIKALCKTDYEKSRFDAANIEAIRRDKKVGLLRALSNPLITLFLNMGMASVILVGSHLVNSGVSTNGRIIAFMSYFTIISNAIIALSHMLTIISKGVASIGRIEEVLECEPQLYLERLNAEVCDKDEGAPHIEFRDISFAYSGAPVLKNISFKLNHGESLGIIGSTGSGKSTLLALLMRIYAPTKGDILIDGVSVSKIPTEDLKKKFGVVFQNDFLFSGSIRENINFGRNLTDEQIALAMADAQAAVFVSSYPEKTDYRLDIKGANMSGGQKQRLLVSRALAGKPEILILDDSSSALDYKTDAALRKALTENHGKTTTLLVAQRVASIAHCDLILMLDGGEIIGRGSHSEMIECCNEYREIAETQLGGGVILE